MREVYDSLQELEDIDDEIAARRQEVAEAESELETLNAPVEELEKQLGALRSELTEIRERQRALERGAKDKRAKLKQYEERLTRVRNSREETAVYTELDLVRKAAEADEDEALQAMEQATRRELRVDELQEKLDAALGELAPAREELTRRRDEASDTLDGLEDRKRTRVDRLDAGARDAYTRIKGGNRGKALVTLTPDGACGNCFSVLPLQRQNEVRRATALVRCEHCGVILRPAE